MNYVCTNISIIFSRLLALGVLKAARVEAYIYFGSIILYLTTYQEYTVLFLPSCIHQSLHRTHVDTTAGEQLTNHSTMTDQVHLKSKYSVSDIRPRPAESCGGSTDGDKAEARRALG